MYWRCHLPYVTPRSRGRHFCRRGALRGGLRVRFDELCLSLLHPSRGPLCKVTTGSQGGIIVGSSAESIPEGIRGNFLGQLHIALELWRSRARSEQDCVGRDREKPRRGRHVKFHVQVQVRQQSKNRDTVNSFVYYTNTPVYINYIGWPVRIFLNVVSHPPCTVQLLRPRI